MEIETGSIVIAFSTYPRENNAGRFISTVEENIAAYKKGWAINYVDINYEESEEDGANRSGSIKEYPRVDNFHLYHSPLKFHIFGKYDVCFITLTESLNTSSRVFLPTRLENDIKPGYLKTHVLSGIQLKCGSKSTEEKFSDLLGYNSSFDKFDSSFVCISNLKLNNTFLVGNGLHFISLVSKKIDSLLGNAGNSMIIKSFASFEISLVLFSRDINAIKDDILRIRKLRICNLFDNDNDAKNSDIISNSILSDLNKTKKEECINSFVFEDSQSFFGIRLDEENKWFLKELEGFKTRVEWEIKPGHEKYVQEIFEEKNNALDFDVSKGSFIPGKTDCVFDTKNGNNQLSHNHKLYELLRSLENEENSKKYLEHIVSQLKPCFNGL